LCHFNEIILTVSNFAPASFLSVLNKERKLGEKIENESKNKTNG
jgi:hypothetical protein